MNFKDKKNIYAEARKKQKEEIIDWLMEQKFTILTMNGIEAKEPYKTGSGSPIYTANSKIEPYDLSNWKWISIRKGNFEYEISLQAFDIDTKTKNRHALMDRIGIYTYIIGKYNADECYEKMINTGIDLPMTKEKYDMLKEKIETSTV